LKSIHDYISFDSLYYAKIQVIRLKFRTHILKSNPLSGKIVLEYQNELFRELVEGNYRIIYKVISKNQIDILTVHHTSRDLSKRNLGNT
jgi:plasmid stabilization system protein ParE